jgi:hypothetical protein
MPEDVSRKQIAVDGDCGVRAHFISLGSICWRHMHPAISLRRYAIFSHIS